MSLQQRRRCLGELDGRILEAYSRIKTQQTTREENTRVTDGKPNTLGFKNLTLVTKDKFVERLNANGNGTGYLSHSKCSKTLIHHTSLRKLLIFLT